MKGEGMRSKRLAFIVLMAFAMSLPITAACKAPSMAELLPPKSLGYVEISDMEVLYYVLEEIGAAVVKSLDEEKANLPEGVVDKASAVLGAFRDIRPLLPKSASLGVVSVDTAGHGQPSLVFAADLSNALGPLASAAGRLLTVAPHIQIRKTECGTEVVIPDTPIPPIAYTVRDNVLYATLGEGLLDKVLSNAGETLSQSNQFKEVQMVTAENAFLSAYVNIDALRETVLPVMPPRATQIVDLLGLYGIHAAGISLTADEELVGSNLSLLFTENGPGIPGLLSIPNSAPKGIAYIPEDFSFVSRCTIGDPTEFSKKVGGLLEAFTGMKLETAFASAKEKTGIDVQELIASLGGEVTIGVKIPDTLAIPNMLLCLSAKNPEYVVSTLKGFLERLEVPCSEVEIEGKKILMITPGMPIPVTPAIAVDKDMIILGVSSTAVQRALAANESGKNIASKPSFKSAMGKLPADSNIGFSYLDMSDLAQLVTSGVAMAASSAPAEVQPLVGKAMQFASSALKDLGEGVDIAYRTPNGLAVQSRIGTEPLMRVLTNGAALGTKAALMFAHGARETRARAMEVGDSAAPAETPTPAEE
jgi:hypothetical protein